MPVIKYNIDVSILNSNRKLYIENDKTQIMQKLTFWEFLENFLYADIVISELNNKKSISVHGGFLSFFFQLYALLSEFNKNKKTSGFVVGCEQGEFNLELKKDRTEVLIINRDKTYYCNFLSLFNEVQRVYKRIIQFELNQLEFIREDDYCKKFIDNFEKE